MARIALVDASAGTEAAVRAALGDAAVVPCTADAIPADAALAIVERDDPATHSLPVPVLRLVDGVTPLAGGNFLPKPFQANDLRRKVRAMLEQPAMSGSDAFESDWLLAPRIAAPAAAALATARRLGGCTWIVGEAGTGTEHVAAALALAIDDREPVVWAPGDAVPGRGPGAPVVWMLGLEGWPANDQLAFQRFLALDPQRRVIVTSSVDPETALEDGRLVPGLHALLSRWSLRLVPLRERRADIAPLAAQILDGLRPRLGLERATLADEARRLLEAHDWPDNVLELEAVLTRSLAVRAVAGANAIELAASDLAFAPAHLAPFDLRAASAGAATARPGADASTDRDEARRRAVVVALEDAVAARAASAASAAAPQAAASAAVSTRDDAAVEALLAAFAHEIRNPMSTIKTFASLEAARAGDDTRELASLALEASARIDEQLEFLQRYAELAPGTPATIDLVELLAEAAEAAGLEPEVAARRAVPARLDPELARFSADALVAELKTRAAGETAAPVLDAATGRAAGVSIVMGGAAAVDRLNRWVEGASLPWRLALARAAARRAGGDLNVDVEDGELRLLWRAPSASGVESEERSDDDQAVRPDRRRRSRSS